MVIIYDKSYSGHHPEYINHIANFIVQNEIQDKYLFVVHENILDSIPILNKCNTLIVKKDRIQLWNYLNPIKKAIEEFKYLTEITIDYHITTIFFLNIDPYQHLIGTKLFKSNLWQVRGIWFHPYFRVSSNSIGLKTRFKVFTKKIRKKIQLRLMLRNNNIESIFILNDKQAVEYYCENYKSVFKYLPDPISPLHKNKIKSSDTINQIYSETEKEKRYVFLLFGSLNNRKNVLNIIKAFSLLNPTIAQKVSLFILGKCKDSEYEKEILYEIDNCTRKQPKLSLVFKNRYFSDDELYLAISNSDILLAIYKDFFGSSGVIGHAIRHRKKIIASQFGLVGKICEDYNLGLTVDSFSINKINEKISKSYNDRYQSQKKIDYDDLLDKFNPNNFANVLLK